MTPIGAAKSLAKLHQKWRQHEQPIQKSVTLSIVHRRSLIRRRSWRNSYLYVQESANMSGLRSWHACTRNMLVFHNEGAHTHVHKQECFVLVLFRFLLICSSCFHLVILLRIFPCVNTCCLHLSFTLPFMHWSQLTRPKNPTFTIIFRGRRFVC